MEVSCKVRWLVGSSGLQAYSPNFLSNPYAHSKLSICSPGARQLQLHCQDSRSASATRTSYEHQGSRTSELVEHFPITGAEEAPRSAFQLSMGHWQHRHAWKAGLTKVHMVIPRTSWPSSTACTSCVQWRHTFRLTEQRSRLRLQTQDLIFRLKTSSSQPMGTWQVTPSGHHAGPLTVPR